MQTAKFTSGPQPHYTWIPSRGTGVPTEEDKVGVSFLSVLLRVPYHQNDSQSQEFYRAVGLYFVC